WREPSRPFWTSAVRPPTHARPTEAMRRSRHVVGTIPPMPSGHRIPGTVADRLWLVATTCMHTTSLRALAAIARSQTRSERRAPLHGRVRQPGFDQRRHPVDPRDSRHTGYRRCMNVPAPSGQNTPVAARDTDLHDKTP